MQPEDIHAETCKNNLDAQSNIGLKQNGYYHSKVDMLRHKHNKNRFDHTKHQQNG